MLEDETWIVLLEAAGDPLGTPIDSDTLRQLVAAMACEQILALQNPNRYAIQLRVASASPAEALFSATARWSEALRRLGLSPWPLHRSEVVTPEEFNRDRDATSQAASSPSPPFPRGEGDDLLRSAFYDSLTGFPTLALFRDRAQGLAASAAQTGRRLALLVLDIDNFGAVNRDLGFIYGDRVLAELAGRLAKVTEAWPVARLAGDRFVVLVDDGGGGADLFTRRLLDAIRVPVLVKGRALVITASVGMAPVDMSYDLDERLAHAAAAVGAAKEAGGDQGRWYDAGENTARSGQDRVTESVPERLAYVMLLEGAALAANESPSLEEASAIVLQRVTAHTGWRGGHLWVVAAGGTRLEPSGVWHVSGPEPMGRFRKQREGRPLAIGEGLAGGVWRSGHPAWTAELAAEGNWADQEAATEAGLASAVAFPVLAGSTVVGVLEFYDTRPIAPDESFLTVMAAVGAQLGRVFERSAAAAALARSEERYRMLADSLPSFVWAGGRTAACTFVNRRWQEYTGRPAEDAYGDGWLDMIHPDDQSRCLSTYLVALERREPYEMEYRLRRFDGTYGWILDRASPVYESGVFAGYVRGGIDVTERHRAELERHNEGRRFRALAETADVMIIVVGTDRTILDEFLPISSLGYRPGAERGQAGSHYVHPDDVPVTNAAFHDALTHPGPGEPYECRVRHADGSWVWLRVVANNMLDDPLVRGIVYTATDITRFKALQRELEATDHRLQEAEDRLRRAQDELGRR